MQKRTLGQNLEVSSSWPWMYEYEFGLWPGSRQGRDDQVDSCRHDLGVTHFDTAEAYGPFANEELVGEATAADPRQGDDCHEVWLRHRS